MEVGTPFTAHNDDEDDEDDPADPIADMVNEIIDEVTLGLCFDVHRSCKLGSLFLADTDPKSKREHEIVDRIGVDVFGNVPGKKQLECVCPNCQRNLAASRFAPHLEKCMGMGRNSSRIASRRSQQVAKENEARMANHGLKRDSDDSPEDDNDVDWTYYQDKKIRRLKKEKRSNSPRRNKGSKIKNGETNVDRLERADTPDSLAGYETMTLEEKKTLLMSTCGVISEHTKRMCTRSHKCPQHSEEQRRQVRHFLLGTGIALDDEDPVDIDTYEDGDSQSLRESLQWEITSTNSSPADSTSTTNSSGSRKRAGKSNSSKSSHKKRKMPKLSHTGSSHSLAQGSSLYDFE